MRALLPAPPGVLGGAGQRPAFLRARPDAERGGTARSVAAALLLLVLLAARDAAAAGPEAAAPGPKDKCPVCGMFVARFPDFAARVRFRDGKTAFFDGVKDMMRYLHGLDRYAPGRRAGDVEAVTVTDYYALAPVDGKTAWYVVGSDVLGPMGREAVPFAREEEAREFLIDHKGAAVLRFEELTPAVVSQLQ